MANTFVYKEKTIEPTHIAASGINGTVVLLDQSTLGYAPDGVYSSHTFHFFNLDELTETAKLEALGPGGEFVLIKASILDDFTVHVSPTRCSAPGNDDLTNLAGRYAVFRVTFLGGNEGVGTNENTGKVSVRSGVTGV
tara:strand:- start:1042 stop:1455 length:414 start_codon:yes stop_codon:yes gene_type:complete